MIFSTAIRPSLLSLYNQNSSSISANMLLRVRFLCRSRLFSVNRVVFFRISSLHSANGNTETNTETNTAGMNTFKLMSVSIHRVLVYLNFKLQGVVVEVKQVAFFIFHRQGDTIHIVVTAICFTQNMWLWRLVVNLFKGFTSNIESSQDCRRFSIEKVLSFVNQVAVHEVGAGGC